VITVYGLVLGLHFASTLAGRPRLGEALAWVGAPAAVLTAVYTAYLFAQARGRDFWQSPLLAPQLLVQAVMAGAAGLLLVAPFVESGAVPTLARLTGASAAVHVLLVTAETTLPHGTAHARLAAWEMTSGRFRGFFRAGLALMAAGALAPWLGPASAAAALLGLLAYEHAYVQAAQAVPLA